MTLTDWIEQLRRAGVHRVTLDIEPHHLPADPARGSPSADPAPRPPHSEPNAQAESHAAQSSDADEATEAPPERDLDLAHVT